MVKEPGSIECKGNGVELDKPYLYSNIGTTRLSSELSAFLMGLTISSSGLLNCLEVIWITRTQSPPGCLRAPFSGSWINQTET